MTLVREIAEWADEQSAWMSDAVRRIVAQGTLSDDDVSDIVALIKESVGEPDILGRVPERVHLDALPVRGAEANDVSIVALRGPRNINAIDFDPGVTFDPAGLTIVYGYNGSGKSGYARALKRACRARNTERVIPNVFAPVRPGGPAQATFDWTEGGTAGSADWTDGTASPQALARIAVFDAHCARVFVDEQAAISYVPYGMDIFRELSNCMSRAQAILERDREAVKVNRAVLSPLTSSTGHVAQFIQGVGAQTDLADVVAMATLTPPEISEMGEWRQRLDDEAARREATALRRLAQRLEAMATELTRISLPLLDEHLRSLAASFSDLKAAHHSLEIASSALKEDALPGTGTEPWAGLLRAAVRFAESAYHGHDFPGPADASCALCQQPLGPEAHSRLVGFWSFLQQDAQRRHDELRARTVDLYLPVKDSLVAGFPTDQAALDELADRAAPLVEAILAFRSALTARQADVVAMAANRQLDALPPLPPSPMDDLLAVVEELTAKAKRLEAALTPQQRQHGQQRLNDLQLRQKLGDFIPAVREVIEAEKGRALLTAAIACCSTRKLTAKSGELYQRVVTADLQAALTRELKALGVAGLGLKFDISGQRGSRMQQLRFNSTSLSPRTKLSDVLSEGEQRAIAIASFLAEVNLESHRSGIVFDDPVNSLDHRRRERISKRLAAEAKNRQVIVFTHDLAFAWELQESAKAHGLKASVRHVFAAGPRKGHCGDALPFEGQQLAPRIAKLKELHAEAREALEVNGDYDAYNDIVRNGYRRLRDCWEVLIEDHLFAGTVKRFQRPVKTLKLRSVSVEDEHAKAVYDGMTRASYFAHEGGEEAPPALPEEHEFLQDIQDLDTIAAKIKASNKATEARREKLGIPKA